MLPNMVTKAATKIFGNKSLPFPQTLSNTLHPFIIQYPKSPSKNVIPMETN